MPDGEVRIYREMINKIYCWRETREKGFLMRAPHCHPYFELFYVESGACSFLLKTTCMTCTKATFCSFRRRCSTTRGTPSARAGGATFSSAKRYAGVCEGGAAGGR